MFELAKLAGYLLSPLTLAFGLFLLAGLGLVLRRRALATGLAVIAVAGLWVASLPVLAQALAFSLESRYPALRAEATPAGDAIVVLGGALIAAAPPLRPTYSLGPAASRVWHAAALYRAGKARWIIVAAGNQPDSVGQQVEAEAIADMLGLLGVPKSAIRLEGQSRNTRENAGNTLPIARALGARRIILVTSALHMPRAMATFQQVWAGSGVAVVAAPAEIAIDRLSTGLKMWIPDVSALGFVTSTLKEIAGMAVLTII